MTLKPISSVLLIALSLSACALTGSETKEMAAVSPAPKATKASLKSPQKLAESQPSAAKCDGVTGFCPLPGLKKYKKAK